MSRNRQSLCAGIVLAASLLAATAASAQNAWTVGLSPTMNPLPAGFCAAIQLTVFDPAAKDVPRNPLGFRVTIADFDISVTGSAVVAHQIDASHWESCACQGAPAGSMATIIASYPAQSLAANARVAGVSLQRAASFSIAPPKGSVEPPACVAAASGNPGGAPAAPAVPVALPPGTPATPRSPTPAPAPAAPPVAVAPPVATTPVPVNPSGFTAVQLGPGQVQLSWQPVNGVSFYGLFGPGLTPGGQSVSGTTTVVATNVPAGLQQWAVGSFYSPGNVSTQASAFPSVSLNVVAPTPPPATTPPPTPPPPPATTTPPATPPPATPSPSGHYLVTVTGFRAYQASSDDPLHRDGVGDEVYAAAYVRRYNQQTGQILEANVRQTATFGDVLSWGTQRLQGGTRSASGGIQDGDPTPDGPLIAMRSVPAQDTTFPWRVWEGTLTNGVDALVITPSLWEQDAFVPQNVVGAAPTTAYYSQWVQQQQMLNVSLFTNPKVQNQIAQKAFGGLVVGVSGNGANTSGTSLLVANQDQMFITTFGLPLGMLLSASADRPLGLVSSGRDTTALPNRTVVLTRDIIEAALAGPALMSIPSPIANLPFNPLQPTPPIARVGVVAPKPGIIMIQFEDVNLTGLLAFPERPAIYQMFIQVERMP